MQPYELDREIAKIEDLLTEALAKKIPWREVWAQISDTGQNFKGVRYPTMAERGAAWSRYQRIIESVKRRQQELRDERERFAANSSHLRAGLIKLGEEAVINTFDSSGSEIFAMLLSLGIPGVNLAVISEIASGKNPFLSSWRERLQVKSKLIKAAWAAFRDQKDELTYSDRQAVFAELKKSQDAIQAEWDRYKNESNEWHDTRRAQAAERRAAWQSKVEANIANNRERLSKLYAVLENKIDYLSRLISERDAAWSDGFREKKEARIEEVESDIADIRTKIERVEGFIEEDEAKLRHSD
jgi:septation ring formation regulator EzrA